MVVDTEFQFDRSMTYPKRVLCFVYKDLTTGQVWKDWVKDDSVIVPKFDFETTLFVCFYATAEVGCFLKTYQGRPPFIFDCWTEYAKLYKNRKQLSMLAAASAYGADKVMSKEDKEANRDLIIKQDTWSKEEKQKILDYCERDVLQTEQIFYELLKDLEKHCGKDYETLLQQALGRGQYMACIQKTHMNGMSVDAAAVNDFNLYWSEVKDAVTRRLNKNVDLFEENPKGKMQFSYKKFDKLLRRIDLYEGWPRTPKGKPKINDLILEIYSKTSDEINEFRRVKNLLDKAKLAAYDISEDGRYRPEGGLRPFATHTGRNAPSSKWIFGTSKWGRNFLKPMHGHAYVYLDFRSEEPFVAARLSGDHVLMKAYNTGDVYLGTAKLAGLVDDAATAKSEPEIRNTFKVLSLAVFYSMGLRSVARSLKKYNYTNSQSAGLLKNFKEQYQITFSYMDQYKTDAAIYGSVHTSMGWSRFFPKGTEINPRSVQNWSIQAESAEVLRNAHIRLTNAGIKVCAPVHDAFLIECPIPELNEQIRIARQCMIDAAEQIVGGTIGVEHDVFYENFTQKKKDQDVFDMIFEEIKKYKQGRVSSQNVAMSATVLC